MRQAAEMVAAAIRDAFKERSDFGCYVEDEHDVQLKVSRALAGTGTFAIVTVADYARRANSGELLTGTITFDVTLFENVPANRAKTGFMTAQGAAQRIAETLHWRRLGGRFESPLRVSGVRRNPGDAKFASVSVTVEAEYLLRQAAGDAAAPQDVAEHS